MGSSSAQCLNLLWQLVCAEMKRQSEKCCHVGLLSLTEKGKLVIINMIVRLSRDGQTVKFKQKHILES